MKIKTKTMAIMEQMYDRYKNGGFYNGDYVKLSKNITKSEYFKSLPAQTQEFIQKNIDTDLRLRVSSVNSIRPANQPGEGGIGAAGDFVADVVIEYAPGLYRNPLSIPVGFLDLLASASDGFGTLPTPDSLIKKTPVHGTQEIQQQTLPTSNTVIANSNKHPDAPGGVAPGLYAKDHKAGTRIGEQQELEQAYGNIIEAKKTKKDYDGDGKVESPEEEYKGVKDKAIKKAKGKKVNPKEQELEEVYQSLLVVNEQPDNLTPAQEPVVNELLDKGFRINKISHKFAEEEGGPTVYMTKRRGGMIYGADVEPNGMVSGKPIDEFIDDYLEDIVQVDPEIEIEDLGDDAVNLAKPIKKPFPDWQNRLRKSFETTPSSGKYIMHQKKI